MLTMTHTTGSAPTATDRTRTAARELHARDLHATAGHRVDATTFATWLYEQKTIGNPMSFCKHDYSQRQT
ncbi:MAG: hypothetical protein ACI8TP_004285 [Acidimicrobiales bacterium]|jgi:hypothetical protein